MATYRRAIGPEVDGSNTEQVVLQNGPNGLESETLTFISSLHVAGQFPDLRKLSLGYRGKYCRGSKLNKLHKALRSWRKLEELDVQDLDRDRLTECSRDCKNTHRKGFPYIKNVSRHGVDAGTDMIKRSWCLYFSDT